MVFKQFYLNCLAQASYLIADERTKTAAVVDPRRDIEPYLEEANRMGATIRHVFLTHFHADFIAGHLELRDRTGATIYLGASAQAEYAFSPMHDGDIVEFGDLLKPYEEIVPPSARDARGIRRSADRRACSAAPANRAARPRPRRQTARARGAGALGVGCLCRS